MKHAARHLRRYAVAAGGSSLVLAASVLLFGGCNPERKAECDRLMAAMKPVSDTAPTAEGVDDVKASVAAIKFEDQTLDVYAKNYSQTLSVLSSTLRLKSSPDAPDGTEDVIKRNLQQARTDAQDTARYCAQ
ncbi:MAG: hypothetical protein ACRENE_22785 [Polyangiaceae bacterium]